MMKLRAIAFDLDGTLIDSAPDIALALNTALAQAGLQNFDLEKVRSWIGDGPDVLIARALQAQGLAQASEDLRTQLRRHFDNATLAEPLSEGTVYEGILPLLNALHGELPLIAVTNKPSPLARAVLRAAGLLPLLRDVWGADVPLLRKPAPAMLQLAADKLNIACAQLLMVGDSSADLQAAQAAGCPAVLVSWGYGAHAVGKELTIPRVNTPHELSYFIQTQTHKTTA